MFRVLCIDLYSGYMYGFLVKIDKAVELQSMAFLTEVVFQL